MTRDEVLTQLRQERAEFDARVEAIPADKLDSPIPGYSHSPKQIIAHVSIYERLIVERLRAARLGETREFECDRIGWEAFNKQMWAASESLPVDVVLVDSSRCFLALLEEISSLEDAELTGTYGVAGAIDQAWLEGRSLAELIAIDGFDHYPKHFAQLEAAARAAAASA